MTLIQPGSRPAVRSSDNGGGSSDRIATDPARSASAAADVANMSQLDPSFEPFDKDISGPITFVKVTGQLNSAHHIESFVNNDKTTYDFIGALDTDKFQREFIGGWGYAARLQSVWTSGLTSRVGFSWNNKSFGRDAIRTDLPSRRVFQSVQASGGRLSGVTQLATLDNAQNSIESPYYKWTVTADFTAYKSNWVGTHDLRFGTWLQPTMHIENVVRYVNDGFTVQDEVLRDPANAGGGTIPFRQNIFDGNQNTNSLGSFSDYAIYIQDSWRPAPRATVTLGVRVDWVKRHDDIFDLDTRTALTLVRGSASTTCSRRISGTPCARRSCAPTMRRVSTSCSSRRGPTASASASA
jgi:outer membrane receptor protein involved in Fe transport